MIAVGESFWKRPGCSLPAQEKFFQSARRSTRAETFIPNTFGARFQAFSGSLANTEPRKFSEWRWFGPEEPSVISAEWIRAARLPAEAEPGPARSLIAALGSIYAVRVGPRDVASGDPYRPSELLQALKLGKGNRLSLFGVPALP